MREGAIAIIERNGRFLTITRSMNVAAPGTICFPGGGIEPNETPEQALCRECVEELGIAVEPVRLLDVFVTPWNVRLYCYAAEMGPEAVIQPNEAEVAAVQWLTISEMLAHPDLLESNRPLLKKLETSGVAENNHKKRLMNTIVLIGYRCTGKTTVASLLGKKCECPVADSDVLVEHRAGKNIAEIFAQDGEAVFRVLEAAVIAELLQQESGKPFVLATGGGAVLREENRTIIKQAGHCVWLTAKPETIMQRIQADAASKTMRPNLTTLPPLEEIVTVLKKREPLYAETADSIIAVDDKTIEEIVDEIINNIG